MHKDAIRYELYKHSGSIDGEYLIKVIIHENPRYPQTKILAAKTHPTNSWEKIPYTPYSDLPAEALLSNNGGYWTHIKTLSYEEGVALELHLE